MCPDVNVFPLTFANPSEHDTSRMLLNMITTSLYPHRYPQLPLGLDTASVT
jgi:hypothetical protein